MIPKNQYVSAALGFGQVATLLKAVDAEQEFKTKLTIFSASETGLAGESYKPAESVAIDGGRNVETLRDFLNQHFMGPALLDRTVPALTELAGAGFLIDVRLPSGVMDGREAQRLMQSAIELFSSAGFNIRMTDNSTDRWFKFHATPIE